MVSGRLRCLGSSHHLKQKFGRGYQLDVTINSKQELEAAAAAAAQGARGGENKVAAAVRGPLPFLLSSLLDWLFLPDVCALFHALVCFPELNRV